MKWSLSAPCSEKQIRMAANGSDAISNTTPSNVQAALFLSEPTEVVIIRVPAATLVPLDFAYGAIVAPLHGAAGAAGFEVGDVVTKIGELNVERGAARLTLIRMNRHAPDRAIMPALRSSQREVVYEIRRGPFAVRAARAAADVVATESTAWFANQMKEVAKQNPRHMRCIDHKSRSAPPKRPKPTITSEHAAIRRSVNTNVFDPRALVMLARCSVSMQQLVAAFIETVPWRSVGGVDDFIACGDFLHRVSIGSMTKLRVWDVVSRATCGEKCDAVLDRGGERCKDSLYTNFFTYESECVACGPPDAVLMSQHAAQKRYALSIAELNTLPRIRSRTGGFLHRREDVARLSTAVSRRTSTDAATRCAALNTKLDTGGPSAQKWRFGSHNDVLAVPYPATDALGRLETTVTASTALAARVAPATRRIAAGASAHRVGGVKRRRDAIRDARSMVECNRCGKSKWAGEDDCHGNTAHSTTSWRWVCQTCVAGPKKKGVCFGETMSSLKACRVCSTRGAKSWKMVAGRCGGTYQLRVL